MSSRMTAPISLRSTLTDVFPHDPEAAAKFEFDFEGQVATSDPSVVCRVEVSRLPGFRILANVRFIGSVSASEFDPDEWGFIVRFGIMKPCADAKLLRCIAAFLAPLVDFIEKVAPGIAAEDRDPTVAECDEADSLAVGVGGGLYYRVSYMRWAKAERQAA